MPRSVAAEDFLDVQRDDRSAEAVRHYGRGEQRAVELRALVGVRVVHDAVADELADEGAGHDVGRPVLVEVHPRQPRNHREAVEQRCRVRRRSAQKFLGV